jgi:hypothetical protein
MNFEVKPFGKQYRFDQQSDISDVVYTSSGLRITVIAATSMFTNVYLDIHFDDVAGFRLLDEGDLLGYWESRAFDQSKHHIYEILSGGWATGEVVDDGVLSRNESVNPYREWFVNTSNLCMNILSEQEPLIREVNGRAAPLL